MKIYVYAIWFPTSKRPNPHYIGVANNLKRRMIAHLNNDSFVGNALNKYDDWIIKKLHTCKTYEEAFRIEIEEIRNFNCVAPNGYNLTHGGEGGDYWSGKKNFGTAKAMIGNQHTKGKHWKLSKETKVKQGRAKLGNQYTKGLKRSDTAKRNKENNPMKNSTTVLKCRISYLKTRIKNLENGLGEL